MELEKLKLEELEQLEKLKMEKIIHGTRELAEPNIHSGMDLGVDHLVDNWDNWEKWNRIKNALMKGVNLGVSSRRLSGPKILLTMMKSPAMVLEEFNG